MSFWPQPRFRGRWGLGERVFKQQSDLVGFDRAHDLFRLLPVHPDRHAAPFAGSLASLSLAALFGMARLCYLYFEAPADRAIRAYFLEPRKARYPAAAVSVDRARG